LRLRGAAGRFGAGGFSASGLGLCRFLGDIRLGGFTGSLGSSGFPPGSFGRTRRLRLCRGSFSRPGSGRSQFSLGRLKAGRFRPGGSAAFGLSLSPRFLSGPKPGGFFLGDEFSR
jgi:hypothetical protein